MTREAPRVVVLGGGVGGQVAANELCRRLDGRVRVTLVEREAHHAFAPSFLWVMTGDRSAAAVTRPLRALLHPGVQVVTAEATGIDFAARRVETTAGQIEYEFLVVALGAELASDQIPGLPEAAHGFYTLDAAVRLREALRSISAGTVAVVVSSLPYKCPGALHEAAMLVADLVRRRGLAGRVAVHLFTPEPRPMPVAGPALGEAVRGMLDDRGVHFHPGHALVAVDPASRELVFEGRGRVRADLIVAIPPHRAPALVREAGLANEAGWVPVDPRTLATSADGVFAVGDVTALPLPGRWKPDVPLMLPKAGVFAHAQALVVARRLAAAIAGTTPTATFCGDGFCMLEAGGALAGVAYGDFFAQPAPRVAVRSVGKAWHLGKVLFERWWLQPWGPRRAALKLALQLGSCAAGIPVSL